MQPYTLPIEIGLVQHDIHKLAVLTFHRVCEDYPQATHLCIIAHTSSFNDGDVPSTRFSTLLLHRDTVSESDVEKLFYEKNNLYENHPLYVETLDELGIVYERNHLGFASPVRVKIDRTLCRMLDVENHWHYERSYVITKDCVTALATNCYNGD